MNCSIELYILKADGSISAVYGDDMYIKISPNKISSQLGG